MITPWLTTKQAAERLGMSAKCLRDLVNCGEGPPSYNVCTEKRPRWRFHVDEVDQWLTERIRKRRPQTQTQTQKRRSNYASKINQNKAPRNLQKVRRATGGQGESNQPPNRERVRPIKNTNPRRNDSGGKKSGSVDARRGVKRGKPGRQNPKLARLLQDLGVA